MRLVVGPPEEELELELDAALDDDEPGAVFDDADELDDFESLLQATNRSSTATHHSRLIIDPIMGGRQPRA